VQQAGSTETVTTRLPARAPRAARLLAIAAVSALCLAPPVPAAAQTQTQTLPTAATLMADQIYVDGAGRLVAVGSVEVWQGSIRLTATRVVYDRRQNQLDVQGPIVINDGPDRMLLADAAQLSPDLRGGLIAGANVVLHQQMQIAAVRLQRSDGVAQLDQVVASSCPVCAADPTPLWEIRAQGVTLDETAERMRFDRAQFRVGGVPILYLPTLHLPGPGATRVRGFLRPEITLDSDLGLAVGLPYFIPLGDSQDITLTPMLSSGGSATLGFRWRQARPGGGIEVGGQISHDSLTADDLRGYAYVRALFLLGDGWQLRADMTGVSDRTYLETYGITDEARLAGDITLERITRDSAARARALVFHSLRVGDVNDELPNAALQTEYDRRFGLEDTLVGGTLDLQMGAQAYERISSIDGVRGRDIARAHVQLTWRRSAVLAGGIVATAALDARADYVEVSDDSAYPVPVNRRAVQAMTEFRWPWATSTADGARHVIEPVVQVIGSQRNAAPLPNDDHTMPELDSGNLFALTRYSGEDAPDNGTRLNAGIRWTRSDASGWSTELLAGRIWREAALAGFNPAHDQPLGGVESHWLLAGRVSHGDGLSFDMRLLIDPANDLSRAETNLSWAGDRTEITTRYLFLPATAFEDRATTLSEWSLDLGRDFRNGWRGVMGWDYDVELSQFAAARAGIEFRNECLALDLSVTQRFVTATNPTSSTRYNIRFELLGIGGRAPSTLRRTCGA